MLVQLPEEQTQEIHHFKEDIGADSPFLNKKTDL